MHRTDLYCNVYITNRLTDLHILALELFVILTEEFGWCYFAYMINNRVEKVMIHSCDVLYKQLLLFREFDPQPLIFTFTTMPQKQSHHHCQTTLQLVLLTPGIGLEWGKQRISLLLISTVILG